MDDRNNVPTVDEIVNALRVIGCEGPASAADVLDQVDVLYDRDTRSAILQAMDTRDAHDACDARDAWGSDPGE